MLEAVTAFSDGVPTHCRPERVASIVFHPMHELSRRAHDLRRQAGLEEPPYSTRHLVDSCFPEILVTGRHLPAGIDELLTVTDSGPVIYYHRGLSSADQRFAIAHALGHVLFDLEAVERRCMPGRPGDPDAELRADLFAAELLVPALEVDPYVGMGVRPSDPAGEAVWLDMIDEIASHFNAPSWVVEAQVAAALHLRRIGHPKNGNDSR